MPPTDNRVRGLDLARALAVFGMVIVNYELALGASDTGPRWLGALTGALQGRSAATFVVLAGVGVSLGSASARASGDPVARRAARARLVRRGLAIGALGVLFMTIWPPDILHFYGAYFMLSAALLCAPSGVVAATLLMSIVGATAFLVSGAWPEHWDLATLEYRTQWTVAGFTRSLFFDGFHPVLPWFALFLYGVLLGRAPLAGAAWLNRAGIVGGAVWLALELVGRALAPAGIETPGARALCATSCFPPTPAFVVCAGGFATAVIAVSAALVRSAPTRLVQPLEATGRLALTIYLAHVIVGLGALEALGLDTGRELPFAVGAAAGFCAASVACATWWTRRFSRGPLEALIRLVG